MNGKKHPNNDEQNEQNMPMETIESNQYECVAGSPKHHFLFLSDEKCLFLGQACEECD